MNARALLADLEFVLDDSGHTILGRLAFVDEGGVVRDQAGLIVRLRDGSQFQVLVKSIPKDEP